MIKKKYLKKIAVVAATAALLFQVQPAIAADIFEDGETTAAAEEIQEPEAVPMAAAEENAEAAETSEEAAAVEVAPVEIEPIEIEPIDIDIPAADDTESTEEPAEEAHPEESAQEEAEEITEAAVEESGAEGTSDQETEVPKENVEAEELQPETPEYKTDFQFENSEVKITATATEEAKLPQNPEMRAVKLEEGTAAYEEAKAASAQTLGTSDDASYCFYDVTFVADEQELSPEKGTVTIKMEFKNIQVNAEAQTQNIVHIEDTEAGRQVQDVTSVSGDGSNLQSVDFAM